MINNDPDQGRSHQIFNFRRLKLGFLNHFETKKNFNLGESELKLVNTAVLSAEQA